MSIGLRLRHATYDASSPDLSAFGGPTSHDAPLDEELWQTRPVVASKTRRVGARPRARKTRRLVSMVAVLPMMWSTLAHAGPPGGLIPEAPAPAAPPSPAAEGPVPQRPRSSDPQSEAPTTSTEAPSTVTTASAAPRPEPVASDGLALTGTSLWQGLMQRDVRLVLSQDREVSGLVLSQSTTHLAIAESSEGAVVTVDKGEIVAVEVMPRHTIYAHSDGTGLLAGGGILLALGVPTTIAGLVLTTLSPYFGMLFLPGPFAVGAGIPMVIVGSHRRQDYRRQFGRDRQRRLGRLAPDLRLGRHGAAAGVTWRF